MKYTLILQILILSSSLVEVVVEVVEVVVVAVELHADERTIKFTNQPLENNITLPKASIKERNFLRTIHAINCSLHRNNISITTILVGSGLLCSATSIHSVYVCCIFSAFISSFTLC